MLSFRLATSAAVVFIFFVCMTAGAQGPPPAVRSPDVHGDRRVTFRLRAPDAARVELVGEVLQGKGPQAMTKGADGVWSITVGPLPPEIWIYNFRIEGVDLPDPGEHQPDAARGGDGDLELRRGARRRRRRSTTRVRCRTATCAWCCTSRRRWA